MSNKITVPSPSSTVDVAARILAFIAAQTGVLTDLIPGSIIRTLAESIGSVISINAVEIQAQALQAILYGGYSAFNVLPLEAASSSGIMTFATAATTPYPSAATNIDIPLGTLIQTSGGIQFQTTDDAVIVAGTGSITANAQAVIAGTTGNVAASSVVNIVTPLPYVVYPINLSAFSGGANAESSQQTASRFANVVAALQLSSPQAIASAVIGVANGTELVEYATVYEPWLTEGSGPYTDGFTVFVDNGSGAASNTLLGNVSAFINGDTVAFTTPGYRPAGVNFAVSAVGPVDVNVTVNASGAGSISQTTLNSLITTAVDGYFSSLNFGSSAQLAFLSTQVSNSIINEVSALTIQMALTSAPTTAVSAISIPPTSRAILSTLTINLS